MPELSETTYTFRDVARATKYRRWRLVLRLLTTVGIVVCGGLLLLVGLLHAESYRAFDDVPRAFYICALLVVSIFSWGWSQFVTQALVASANRALVWTTPMTPAQCFANNLRQLWPESLGLALGLIVALPLAWRTTMAWHESTSPIWLPLSPVLFLALLLLMVLLPLYCAMTGHNRLAALYSLPWTSLCRQWRYFEGRVLFALVGVFFLPLLAMPGMDGWWAVDPTDSVAVRIHVLLEGMALLWLVPPIGLATLLHPELGGVPPWPAIAVLCGVGLMLVMGIGRALRTPPALARPSRWLAPWLFYRHDHRAHTTPGALPFAEPDPRSRLPAPPTVPDIEFFFAKPDVPESTWEPDAPWSDSPTYDPMLPPHDQLLRHKCAWARVEYRSQSSLTGLDVAIGPFLLIAAAFTWSVSEVVIPFLILMVVLPLIFDQRDNSCLARKTALGYAWMPLRFSDFLRHFTLLKRGNLYFTTITLVIAAVACVRFGEPWAIPPACIMIAIHGLTIGLLDVRSIAVADRYRIDKGILLLFLFERMTSFMVLSHILSAMEYHTIPLFLFLWIWLLFGLPLTALFLYRCAKDNRRFGDQLVCEPG